MPKMTEESFRFWDLFLKAGSAIGFILTVLFSFYQYQDTATRESKKPFLEKQLELCIKATDSAGTIATSPRPEEVASAKVVLDQLTWGSMAIVDNQEIFEAMYKFNAMVKTLPSADHYQETKSVRASLTALSEKIAHACRDHVRTAWSVPNPLQ